jgi:hypothetical protein
VTDEQRSGQAEQAEAEAYDHSFDLVDIRLPIYLGVGNPFHDQHIQDQLTD